MTTIYSENKCDIQVKTLDSFETEICVNGESLIVIQAEKQEEFEIELSELLNRYKI